VQVAYAIGKAERWAVIETFGTETAERPRSPRPISETFDLRPAAIIATSTSSVDLIAQTAAYGHFGRELPDFTWERTDKAEQLASCATVNPPESLSGLCRAAAQTGIPVWRGSNSGGRRALSARALIAWWLMI